MGSRKVDRRIQRTRQLLDDALIELILEKRLFSTPFLAVFDGTTLHKDCALHHICAALPAAQKSINS